MLVTTINLFRMAWPFLREVLFGRDSVKAWVKKNGITLIWMLFIILMLVVVLKLVMLSNREANDIKNLTDQKTDLEQQLKAEQTVEAGLRAQIDKLKSPRGNAGHAENVGVAPSSYPSPQPRLSAKDQDLYDQLRQLKKHDEEN
jgi:hypothetical protein